jgi:hypothetical protein
VNDYIWAIVNRFGAATAARGQIGRPCEGLVLGGGGGRT